MNFVLYKNVSLKVTIISKYSTDFILTKFAPRHFLQKTGSLVLFPLCAGFITLCLIALDFHVGPGLISLKTLVILLLICVFPALRIICG